MAIQQTQRGPLGSSIVTPSEQISQMTGMEFQEPSLEEASRVAEEEYFNVPPVSAQPTPTEVPSVSPEQTMPMEEVDTSPLGQLRSSYIEAYESLFGQSPALTPNQAQDPNFLQEQLAKVEENRQFLMEQGGSIEPELTPEEKEIQTQLNRIQQAGINHETKTELQSITNGKLSDLDVGSVYQFTSSLAEPLASTKAVLVDNNQQVSFDGPVIDFIGQSLNLNRTQTINAISSASLLSMNALARTKAGGTGTLGELVGLDFANEGPDAVPFKEGVNEPTKTDFVDMVSAALGKVSKAGMAAAQQEYKGARNSKAAAEIVVDSLLDTGYLTEVTNKDGQQVIRLTSYGTEVTNATKNFLGVVVEGMAGKSMSVPASSTANFPQKTSRPGDLAKRSIEGYVDTPPEMELAKATVGSVGHVVDLESAVLLKMVYIEAEREVVANNKADKDSGLTGEGLKELQQSRKRKFKIEKQPSFAEKFKLGGVSTIESRASELAMEDKQRDFGYLADNIETPDKTRYGVYRYDPSSGRMYLDSVDINSQRSKLIRAAMRGNPTPIMLKQRTFKASEPIFTDKEITNWWKGMGERFNKKVNPNSLDAEMDALVTIAIALEPDMDGKTPLSVLKDLSLQKLQGWAQKGLDLSMATMPIVSLGSKGVADFVRNAGTERDFSNLPASTKNTFTEIFKEDPNVKRDNLGYKLKAYMDAYKYMQAKKDGGSFIPKTTFAIDMNSAGRAVLASDIGNETIAARVGLVWKYIDDVFGTTLSEKGQTPRTLFTKTVIDTTIRDVYTPKDFEIQNGLKALFNEYMDDKDFNSSFAKKVLLTTDYGKPAQFHLEEAKIFLLDNPEFADKFMAITGLSFVESMFKINDIYASTLKTLTHTYQQQAPKNMVRLMQMVGTMFGFKGMLNETIPLGGNMYVSKGDELIYTTPSGKAAKLQLTTAVFDNIASSKKKVIEIWDEEKQQLVKGVFDPGPGSAAVNAIGPFLGQYRESMILMDTINAVNGNRKPEEMAYMIPVFDNFILDAQSLPQVMWYANNVATPKVLQWNTQDAISKDFVKRLNENLAELRKIGKQTIMIPRSGKYYGIYSSLDYKVKPLLKDTDKQTEADKKFLATLKQNGYEYIEDRDKKNFVGELTGNQIEALANAFFQRYVRSYLSDWVNAATNTQQKPKLLLKILQAAKDGMIFFMT